MQKKAQPNIYCIQGEIIVQGSCALPFNFKVLDILFGTIFHAVLECFLMCPWDYGKLYFFPFFVVNWNQELKKKKLTPKIFSDVYLVYGELKSFRSSYTSTKHLSTVE